MKPQELTINSEVLEEFRKNFDGALAMLVRELREKRMPEGSITAKLKVTMEEAVTMDGQVVKTLSIKPDVSVKLGASGKIECHEKAGMFMQTNEEGVPVVGSCQMDIDELLAKEATG